MSDNVIRMVKPFYIDVLVMGSGYIEICFNEPKEFFDHEIFDIEKVHESWKELVSIYEEINISEIYDTNYESLPLISRDARAFRLSTREDFVKDLERLLMQYCVTENKDYPLECEYKQHIYKETLKDVRNFAEIKSNIIAFPKF